MKHPFSTSTFWRGAFLLPAILLLPNLAQAHPGIPGHAHGVANGLTHPLTGLDHILAMVAVGVWAAQRGGRSLWAVPLTFVTVMALGGLLGMTGGVLPFAEAGIALSVLILGVLIAGGARLSLSASAVIVGTFALFHGFAHGAEMPATASGLEYGIGALLATAGLHLCGISLGLMAARTRSWQLVRCAGGVIAAGGVYLCFTA